MSQQTREIRKKTNMIALLQTSQGLSMLGFQIKFRLKEETGTKLIIWK